MADRTNRVTTYLSDEEYAVLKEWSETTTKPMSHLLREAILEYTDRDRTARIEEKLDQFLAELENIDHTHTRHGTSTELVKSVPDKARKIVDRIYTNHDMPVNNKDVEIAVEDIAGGDDRTLTKYKNQLKKRGHLYEHPVSPVWTDDNKQWVEWVENATVQPDIHKITEEYSITTDEYKEIAEAVVE